MRRGSLSIFGAVVLIGSIAIDGSLVANVSITTFGALH